MGRLLTAMAWGFAALASAVPARAGPAVATRWQDVKLSQEECLRKAEAAILRTGFNRMERTEQSRYGTLDTYTAAIRCVVDNGIAFFIVSGPSRVQSDLMAGALFENWK